MQSSIAILMTLEFWGATHSLLKSYNTQVSMFLPEDFLYKCCRMSSISDEQRKRQRTSSSPLSEHEDSEVHITPSPSPLEESGAISGIAESAALSILYRM